jgi:hypothetical protein
MVPNWAEYYDDRKHCFAVQVDDVYHDFTTLLARRNGELGSDFGAWLCIEEAAQPDFMSTKLISLHVFLPLPSCYFAALNDCLLSVSSGRTANWL